MAIDSDKPDKGKEKLMQMYDKYNKFGLLNLILNTLRFHGRKPLRKVPKQYVYTQKELRNVKKVCN